MDKILKDVLEDANFSSSREFHYKSKLSCTRKVNFCCSSIDFPLLRKIIQLKKDLFKGLVKIKHCKALRGNWNLTFFCFNLKKKLFNSQVKKCLNSLEGDHKRVLKVNQITADLFSISLWQTTHIYKVAVLLLCIKEQIDLPHIKLDSIRELLYRPGT